MISHPVKLYGMRAQPRRHAGVECASGKKLRKPVAPQATADSAVPCRGANLFHCGPLYNGNDYLGDDPDPFIRLMIQRDLGARYGGCP